MSDTTTTAAADDIGPETTLAALVTRRPELARHLEARSLDYCCHGQRSLADAATAAGLDPASVVEDLRAVATEGPAPGWAGLTPAELVDHIESTHHAYLHKELPRLAALAEKVAGVHGDRHPELVEVRATFDRIHAELVPHLEVEETRVFPFVRDLESGRAAPSELEPLREPMAQLLVEHDSAGELLERIVELTGRYSLPGDACASYTALYQGLAQFESDLHLHVHKENNLLFPAILGH